ncbi:amidohydrolase [Chryseolinea lacunae]|uniref:Amidohydrolase family protein n=1 Tax=Chryseolinea lacunae TaxID=2801331 RepID=A0ABS1KL77_9BACT|nr:amidohydrolase [Chryseolinea lacunae]MBL0740089.1 amidohydrolase family protein [Chryseolinea lacunae]
MKKILYSVALLAVATLGYAQVERGNLLIKNGTVLTVTKGTFENTDVLVKDGKISQIGKNIAAPAGVKVIDASGQFVMPGIIDAHSHAGLDAINEATAPVTAEVFTGDGLNPFQVGLYRALGGGVTTIHAMHGSANAIGGQCETIKLRYGVKNADDLRMEGAPRTIKFALGENPTRVHGGGNGIVPRTRMGVEFVIRESFSKAREYRAAWDKYNKAKTQKGFRGAPPEYNLRLETLADILKGDIIIHCHSYRADEISMLLNVCKDFGVKRLVFQHVNEGFKVAPELAKFGAMASVFADWWAYKFEVYYSTAYNAAILTRNGVVTSINSDDGELMRHLYHEAAKTQKYGALTDDEALALITLNPAKQLGIDARVGSLEVGKEADIAIFNAHPLSSYTIPTFTVVDGVVRFDRAKDPDDMRIYVDPTQAVDMATFRDREQGDHCLDGAEENLVNIFGLN